MRLLIVFFLFVSLAACCPRTAPVPTSAEERAHEAEQLVRVSLTERLAQDTVDFYRDQVTAMLVQDGMPRAEAEAQVAAALQTLTPAEHQRLVDALVPIYQRYYTAAEIHQLLSFYQTEVAHKSLRVSSQIAGESRGYVRLWSEHFGAELLQAVGLESHTGGAKN